MEMWVTSVIASCVTLAGIVVSYVLSKKNLEGELRRLREQEALTKSHDFPRCAASLMDDVEAGMSPDELKKLLTDIYAYGSPEAIRIIVEFQETNYRMARSENIDPLYLISLVAVLISQLKYDLTGRTVDPENWLRLRITDYNPSRSPIPGYIKEISKNLGISLDYN